ncbi:MAG TPA: hypothetical protein VMU68_14530 [Acidimicrobiales bacterium]|nr:hypothetical protein [Acidimicrobiales bacterium]
MNDELLRTLMQSLDPARGLSDATLDELLPHDQLMVKIAAGIADEQPEPRYVKPIPIWRQVPTLVGTAAVAIALVITGAATLLSNSPTVVQGKSAGAKTVAGGTTGATVTGAQLAVSKCMASHINEWAAGHSARYVATENFRLKIIYTNTGPTCYLPITYVGFQPVSGANHSPVGMGSATPTVYVNGKVVLKHGETAAADLTIGSTTSKQFLRLEKSHGARCAPSFATGVDVLGLYGGWPTKYFGFNQRLAICTTHFDNVGGSFIAKTKKIMVHG